MSSFFSRNLKRHYPTVKSASGCWITDEQGHRFLDGCSGAVSANLGHGCGPIQEAIRAQLQEVAFAHTSQFVSQPALKLADQLIALAPGNFKGGRVYFVSGGSEAVETALKMARSYFIERDGVTNKQLVISRWNSYHGSTFGAMSVTGHPARRKPYLPLLNDQPHIDPAYPYRCSCANTQACTSEECGRRLADRLEEAIQRLGSENVVAFLAEPVVGAALGAVAPQPGYWKRVEEICRRHDILFIADEVMTGLGRCGANFAVDLWGVQPDIIVAGKGLAAGYMPLAAVLASATVAAAFERGSGVFEHGFTYSGHPLSCAAGLAAIEFLKAEKLVQRVAERSVDFQHRLEDLCKFDMVGDVRSTGFLGGIEFVRDKRSKEPFEKVQSVSRKVAEAAWHEGLIVYPGAGFLSGGRGDHVIIAPPFTIADAEIETLFARLEVALQAVSKQLLVPV